MPNRHLEYTSHCIHKPGPSPVSYWPKVLFLCYAFEGRLLEWFKKYSVWDSAYCIIVRSPQEPSILWNNDLDLIFKVTRKNKSPQSAVAPVPLAFGPIWIQYFPWLGLRYMYFEPWMSNTFTVILEVKPLGGEKKFSKMKKTEFDN